MSGPNGPNHGPLVAPPGPALPVPALPPEVDDENEAEQGPVYGPHLPPGGLASPPPAAAGHSKLQQFTLTLDR